MGKRGRQPNKEQAEPQDADLSVEFADETKEDKEQPKPEPLVKVKGEDLPSEDFANGYPLFYADSANFDTGEVVQGQRMAFRNHKLRPITKRAYNYLIGHKGFGSKFRIIK